MLFAGGIYGLIWGGFLFVYGWKESRKEFSKSIRNDYVIGTIILGMILSILGLFSILFLFFGIFFIFGIVLYVFAKSVEKISMIREISVKELREGDWLAENVRLKGKIIKWLRKLGK